MSEVSLRLLHSLHTGVDGPHEGLLSQVLTTSKAHFVTGAEQGNVNTRHVNHRQSHFKTALQTYELLESTGDFSVALHIVPCGVLWPAATT